MIENRIEELHREESDRDVDARGDKPLGTADLLKSAAESSVKTDEHRSEAERTPLFQEDEISSLRRQWQETQTQFVDDPRSAVRHADELVASAMKRLAEIFAAERGQLEHGWDKGENVSTEDLRQALRRYRSFFDRLLSA